MKLNNRQRAKLTLDELEKEMEILTKEGMNACKREGDMGLLTVLGALKNFTI